MHSNKTTLIAKNGSTQTTFNKVYEKKSLRVNVCSGTWSCNHVMRETRFNDRCLEYIWIQFCYLHCILQKVCTPPRAKTDMKIDLCWDKTFFWSYWIVRNTFILLDLFARRLWVWDRQKSFVLADWNLECRQFCKISSRSTWNMCHAMRRRFKTWNASGNRQMRIKGV